MIPNVSLAQNKEVLRLRVEHIFRNLVEFKNEENKVSFNAQLMEVLPEVKKYINGRLHTAIKKGNFPKNKYKADDFINQLFIEVYNHIDTIKKENDFYVWLFKKTEELLEDTIVEEEFDDFFFKNIDAYSKPEWDEMEQNFTTDGDGDLMMVEELDDILYNYNNYTLQHVFIEDDEKELTKQLDKKLNAEEVNKHVKMVLHNLPLPMRTVFILSTQQHLNIGEIAELKNISSEAIKKQLDNAKKALQISLFNRYEES